MQHSLECFARLVRLLLGSTAIAEAKMDCGKELCILGVFMVVSLRLRCVAHSRHRHRILLAPL